MNELKNMFLKQNLIRFGLNPSEWLMIPERPSYFRLTHVLDDNFQIRGKTTQNDEYLRWENLEIISI